MRCALRSVIDCFRGRKRRNAHAVYGRARRAASDVAEIHRRRDQPACRRMGGGGPVSVARAVQEAWRPWFPRTEQAGRIWRRRARLFLRDHDGGGTGGRSQRLGSDGDRRADRHGDARARPVRLGRIAPRVPRARDFGRRDRLRRRVGARRRLRRRRDQNECAIGRRRLRHRWRQDVDHQRRRGRLDVPARQHRGGAETATNR